jgi:hypothetical protein
MSKPATPDRTLHLVPPSFAGVHPVYVNGLAWRVPPGTKIVPVGNNLAYLLLPGESTPRALSEDAGVVMEVEIPESLLQPLLERYFGPAR